MSQFSRALTLAVCVSMAFGPTVVGANTTDHRVNLNKAVEEVAIFKEWVIGAGRRGSVDGVLTPLPPPGSKYTLKNLEKRRFLQFEDHGRLRGIKLGYTNNANARTEKSRRHWILVPKNQMRRPGGRNLGLAIRQQPIRYGETIAIGYHPQRRADVWSTSLIWNFLHYDKRRVGINLEWKRRPSYEWAILGGKPGTPVRLDRDRVVLFNLKNRQPMIYYPRPVGGHVGWPTSTAGAILKKGKKKKLRREIWNQLLMRGQ